MYERLSALQRATKRPPRISSRVASSQRYCGQSECLEGGVVAQLVTQKEELE